MLEWMSKNGLLREAWPLSYVSSEYNTSHVANLRNFFSSRFFLQPQSGLLDVHHFFLRSAVKLFFVGWQSVPCQVSWLWNGQIWTRLWRIWRPCCPSQGHHYLEWILSQFEWQEKNIYDYEKSAIVWLNFHGVAHSSQWVNKINHTCGYISRTSHSIVLKFLGLPYTSVVMIRMIVRNFYFSTGTIYLVRQLPAWIWSNTVASATCGKFQANATAGR